MEDFTIKTLRKLKDSRMKLFNFPICDPYHDFLNDLHEIFKKRQNPRKWKDFESFETTGIVKIQSIGTITYKHTTHTFNYIYLAPNSSIEEHLHIEYVNKGGQKKNVTEFLFYPNGLDKIIKPHESHKIENNSSQELYVLSVKVTSKRSY